MGPVVAAKLLGRSRHASRFATAASFASYCGVAPIEVASRPARHRLPRGGDRQLNLALHIIALTQVRMRHSTGHAYYDTKIACREVTQRGDALPETAVGRSRVAADGSRRTDPDSGPGRTFWGVSAVQRGWLDPDRQLFGQVTSRARRVQLYDPEISSLTNARSHRRSA